MSKLDIHKIQAAARSGRIRWRYHALLRARERGIERQDALRVIQKGEILEEQPRTQPLPKCLMMAFMEGQRPLYVALGYDEQDNYLYIITVHWLDPSKWDDPWTRKPKKSKL